MSHLTHLREDKKLWKILKNRDPILLTERRHMHLQLCASIISQQLSTRVAEVIYGRFLALFPSKNPSAKVILNIAVEDLRTAGVSGAKAGYIYNVCTFFIVQNLKDAQFKKMNNEEIISLLTQIKGIGRWTVEMILMFSLGREDVFAIDDLGIQQAMTKLYDLDATNKKQLQKNMVEIAEKWRPYRTYACRYLWDWKDSA